MFQIKYVGCMRALMLAGAVLSSAAAANAANYVNLFISHVNDQDAGYLGYRAQLEVQMDDTSVNVVVDESGGDIGLVQDTTDPHYWQVHGNYPVLTDLLNDLPGNYTVTATTTGGGVSTMHFTIEDLSGLDENSFLALPQITSPTNGQTGLPAQPTFTWNPTADLADAQVISASFQGDNVWQDDSSAAVAGGSMNLSDTTWTPSVTLDINHPTFTISYGETNGAIVPLLLTNFSQDAGTGGIVWTTSPYAPASEYGSLPSGLPLLALISQNTVGFQTVPEPATLGLIALAGPMLLMRRRGRCDR